MHVVITGAGRGIGRELAARYGAAGHQVTGTARDGSAEVMLDVTRPEDHVRMAEDLAGRPVDLLVCNAGVYLDKGQRIDGGFPPELWAASFAANVTGVFLGIQALLPNLRAASGAKIAIIASRLGSHNPAPGAS